MKVPEPDDVRPLAWQAILQETSVRSRDDQTVGVITEVIGAEEADIFHGIVVSPGQLGPSVLVPADQVSEITNREVRVDLSAEELRKLPPYQEEESYKLGFVGLLGKRLGWVQDRHNQS